MNRLIKVINKVEVDFDVVEKLLIIRKDFIYVLEYDCIFVSIGKEFRGLSILKENR